jgi:hypothetical protein
MRAAVESSGGCARGNVRASRRAPEVGSRTESRSPQRPRLAGASTTARKRERLPTRANAHGSHLRTHLQNAQGLGFSGKIHSQDPDCARALGNEPGIASRARGRRLLPTNSQQDPYWRHMLAKGPRKRPVGIPVSQQGSQSGSLLCASAWERTRQGVLRAGSEASPDEFAVRILTGGRCSRRVCQSVP